MNRTDVFRLVGFLIDNGNAGGRRAAATALEQFPGPEADSLLMRCLDDPDPHVQATAVTQLRERGIPGAAARLIERLESPHAVVREAAQRSMSELQFGRYLATFDLLDDELRQQSGSLVRKVDPGAVEALGRELQASGRTRKLRALEMAPCLRAVADLEWQIIRLLDDEDHFVRAAAARTLGLAPTASSREALERAAADASASVREAAGETLEQLAALLDEAASEPRAREAEATS